MVVQGGVTTGLLNALVAQDLPGPGSVFLHTDLNFRAPVRPGDLITAEAVVTGVRDDKPVCTLRLTITDQHDVVVLDGTAVVWRDPTVAAAADAAAAPAGITDLPDTAPARAVPSQAVLSTAVPTQQVPTQAARSLRKQEAS
ncbi:hypothetical protein ACVBEQ_24415 [Nakamurella sp. GG22]